MQLSNNGVFRGLRWQNSSQDWKKCETIYFYARNIQAAGLPEGPQRHEGCEIAT